VHSPGVLCGSGRQYRRTALAQIFAMDLAVEWECRRHSVLKVVGSVELVTEGGDLLEELYPCT
jgi:hypothetical protein